MSLHLCPVWILERRQEVFVRLSWLCSLSLLKRANLLLRPKKTFLPIIHHHKTFICKSSDRTPRAADKIDCLLLLFICDPWEFYNCKTFLLPRKATQIHDTQEVKLEAKNFLDRLVFGSSSTVHLWTSSRKKCAPCLKSFFFTMIWFYKREDFRDER